MEYNMNLFACRLCLSEEKLTNMLNNDSLSDSVSKYLSVHVTGDDNLPTVICDKCETIIKNWIEYTLNVRKVQITLTNRLKKVTTDSSRRTSKGNRERVVKGKSPKKKTVEQNNNINVPGDIRKYLSPSKNQPYLNNDISNSVKDNVEYQQPVTPTKLIEHRRCPDKYLNMPGDIRKFLSPQKYEISNSVEDNAEYQRSVTSEKLTENRSCRDKRLKSKFLSNEQLTVGRTIRLNVPEDIRKFLPDQKCEVLSPQNISPESRNESSFSHGAEYEQTMNAVVTIPITTADVEKLTNTTSITTNDVKNPVTTVNVKKPAKTIEIVTVDVEKLTKTVPNVTADVKNPAKTIKIVTTDVKNPAKTIPIVAADVEKPAKIKKPAKMIPIVTADVEKPTKIKKPAKTIEIVTADVEKPTKIKKPDKKIPIVTVDVEKLKVTKTYTPLKWKPEGSCCTMCDVQLTTRSSFQKHVRSIEHQSRLIMFSDEPYKCFVCNVSLTQGVDHTCKRRHNCRTIRYKCPYCEFSYTVKRSLFKHVKDTHGIKLNLSDVKPEPLINRNRSGRPSDSTKNYVNKVAINNKNDNIELTSNDRLVDLTDGYSPNYEKRNDDSNDNNNQIEIKSNNDKRNLIVRKEMFRRTTDVHLRENISTITIDRDDHRDDNNVENEKRANNENRNVVACNACDEQFSNRKARSNHYKKRHLNLNNRQKVCMNCKLIFENNISYKMHVDREHRKGDNIKKSKVTTTIARSNKKNIRTKTDAVIKVRDDDSFYRRKSTSPSRKTCSATVEDDHREINVKRKIYSDNNRNDIIIVGKTCVHCNTTLSSDIAFHEKYCADFEIVAKTDYSDEFIRICPKCRCVFTSLKELVAHYEKCPALDGAPPKSTLRNDDKNKAPVEKSEITTPVCEYCRKICKSKSGLTQHSKKCPVKLEKTVCVLCQSIFPNESDLKAHRKIYHGNNDFLSSTFDSRRKNDESISSDTNSSSTTKVRNSHNNNNNEDESSFLKSNGNINVDSSRSFIDKGKKSASFKKKRVFLSCKYCSRWFQFDEALKSHLINNHRNVILT